MRTPGILFLGFILVVACGGSDEIDSATSCIALVRAYNELAADTTGIEATELRDRAELRLDELIETAINEGRDADAVVCETSRYEMAIPRVFENISEQLDSG